MAFTKQKLPQTKSDLIRSMPGTPAKQVVAAAAKLKMKLTERYVYVIRSADRAKSKQRGADGQRRIASAKHVRAAMMDQGGDVMAAVRVLAALSPKQRTAIFDFFDNVVR